MNVPDSRWRWETRCRRRPRSAWRGRWQVAGWALLAGLLTLGTLFTGWLSLDPLLRIRAVRFDVCGPGTVPAGQLEAALALPEDASFAALDRSAAQERLLSLPRVARVEFGYGWFHELRVRILERSALALILCAEGSAWEIARDGCCFESRGEGLVDLPLLSWAPEVGTRQPGELIRQAGAAALLDVLATLRAEHPSLWDDLSEAHLRPDGSYELYWNDDPIVAWGWGRLSHQRLTAWSSIMGDLAREGCRDVVIDLRFRKQIIIRHPRHAPAAGWANS